MAWNQIWKKNIGCKKPTDLVLGIPEKGDVELVDFVLEIEGIKAPWLTWMLVNDLLLRRKHNLIPSKLVMDYSSFFDGGNACFRIFGLHFQVTLNLVIK